MTGIVFCAGKGFGTRIGLLAGIVFCAGKGFGASIGAFAGVVRTGIFPPMPPTRIPTSTTAVSVITGRSVRTATSVITGRIIRTGRGVRAGTSVITGRIIRTVVSYSVRQTLKYVASTTFILPAQTIIVATSITRATFTFTAHSSVLTNVPTRGTICRCTRSCINNR